MVWPSFSDLRILVNTYSPYKFYNNSHLVTSIIIIVSLMEHCISTQFSRKKEKAKYVRETLPFVNEYDLAKCLGLMLMIIDHRSYFNVHTVFGETLTWNQKSWCRIIGRGTAPMFFWVAGYSNSFRFRWITFFFAILMVTAVEHLDIGLTYTPFETILEVLALNVIYKYWPPREMTGLVSKWWFHIPLIFVGWYTQGYFGRKVQMQYGNNVFMLSFAGLLAARQSPFAKPWIVGAIVLYGLNSKLFCRSTKQKIGLCTILGMEMIWMLFFKNRELRVPTILGKFIRDASRNAIFYYVIHMCFYRVIVMTQ